MIFTAQLSTLTAVDARLFDIGPGIVDETWDSVALDRQIRYPPSVNNIGGGNQKAHLLLHRDNQRLIHFEQIVGPLGRQVTNLILGGAEITEEADILLQILVFPLPLITGNQNIQIGFIGVVNIDQRLSGRHGHDDKDSEGHNGPEDFQRRTLVEVGRLGTVGLAVHDHGVKHDPEHHHTDTDTPPEYVHMQAVDITANGCDPLGHIDPPTLNLLCAIPGQHL